MISGIGIDIIEIQRIKAAAAKNPRFLERIFTSQELTYCQSKANPWPHLAARFAAKEAVVKALGSQEPVGLKDIEVVKEGSVPSVHLRGKAVARPQNQGVSWQLSLSHSHDYAVAMAIAVVKDDKGAEN